MIRNIVMAELVPDYDTAELDAVASGFRAMQLQGCLSYTLGVDLGLREGNWTFGIVADFVDAEAYRAYDVDAEHNRLRAQLKPLVKQIARLQFEIPDA
jgi:quinol monooxygenase YgiN